MAKLKGNLFGNFSGKIGLTYGRMVNGVNLGANMPVKRGTKGATSSMKDNWVRFATLGKVASAFLGAARLRFKTLVQLAKAFKSAADLGFAKYRWIKPFIAPFNYFSMVNKTAVFATGGEAEVDYGSLLIAKGDTPDPSFGNASFAEPNRVSVTFQATTDMPGADAQDKVYVVLYQPDTNKAILSTPVLRTTGQIEVLAPKAWVGMTVHVYGFVIGDGRDNQGEPSESSYIGTGNIG